MSEQKSCECLIKSNILLIEKGVIDYAEVEIPDDFNLNLHNDKVKIGFVKNSIFICKYLWQFELKKSLSSNKKKNRNFCKAISNLLLK